MSDELTTETTQKLVEKPDNTATPPVESATQSKSETTQGAVTYTEAQYKGLQAVIAKRDATIKDLTENNLKLEAEKAELESNHGKMSNEKAGVDTELTEFKDKSSSLEKENEKLQKKIGHLEIIMKEFPDLVSAVDLIPEVETDEELRGKAKIFLEAFDKHVNTGVKKALGGASPALETKDEGAKLGVDEVDKAYRDVVSLAGIPGKEKEYEQARDQWLSLQEDDK